MSTDAKMETKVLEPGPGRELGTAGQNAVYIERTLERWRMRGDGVLKS